MKIYDVNHNNVPAMLAQVLDYMVQLNDKIEFIKEKEKETSDLITAKELRTRLKISSPTELDWRRKGKIKSFGTGRKILYNWTEVLKDLDREN